MACCLVNIFLLLASTSAERFKMDGVGQIQLGSSGEKNLCAECTAAAPFYSKAQQRCVRMPPNPDKSIWSVVPVEADVPQKRRSNKVNAYFENDDGKELPVPRISSAGGISKYECGKLCLDNEECIMWAFGPSRIENAYQATVKRFEECVMFGSQPKHVTSGGALRLAMKKVLGSQIKLQRHSIFRKWSEKKGANTTQTKNSLCRIKVLPAMKKKGVKFVYPQTCMTLAYRKVSAFSACDESERSDLDANQTGVKDGDAGVDE